MRTTSRFSKYAAATCVAVLVGFAGCAKAPQEEISAAHRAIDTARSAEAADYAPESLRQAEELLAQLDTELQAQQQKFAMTRSYKEAARLATAARQAADQAGIDAAAGKDAVRTQTQTLLGEARAAIDSARTLLSSAPAGKGGQAEIEAMQADLTAAQMQLGEAERAYEAGRFRDAHTHADAAKGAAVQVIDDVTSAKSLRRGGRS